MPQHPDDLVTRPLPLLAIALLALGCLLDPGASWAQDAPDVPGAASEEGLVPPRIKTQTIAAYPRAALEARIGASIGLQIDIDVEGNVESVKIVKLADGEASKMGFEESAVAAVQQWTFHPARENGVPVPVRISYTLHFKPPALEPERAAPAPILNFQGEVLERGTREPLVGVTVTVFQGEGDDSRGFEATTDEAGVFSFYDLDPGVWRVWIEPEGYFPLRELETVTAGQRLEVVYRLERGAYNRFDVLVEGERGQAKVTRRTVSVEELAHMPGIYGDPLKVLRALPGVAQTNAFTSDIVIRGGSPEDTRFFALGLEVPAAFHFGGLRGIFPEGMVKDIVLYPGDFPVHYGRSVGGAVDIVLPNRVGGKVHGYADLSILDSTLYLEVPITDEVWVSGSIRRSYLDVVIASVTLFKEELVLPRYFDAHAQLGWRPNPDHDLRLFVFFADDDLVVYSPQGDPNINEDDLPETAMVQGGARHIWTFSDDVSWTNAVLTGQDRSLELTTLSGLFFVPPGLNGYKIETTTLRVAARSELAVEISPRAKLLTGVDTVFSDVTLTLRPDLNNGSFDENGDFVGGVPEDTPVRFTPTYLELAGYADMELSMPGANLTFIPGARVERFGQVDTTVVDPRLRVQYDPHPDWTLRTAAGLMHQPPREVETSLALTGPGLDPERALQTSAGFIYRPTPTLSAEVTGFYKKLDDLVVLEDEATLRWRNSGRGRAYGIETFVKWPLRSRFNGWVAYTLSRSERRDPTVGKYQLHAFDQTHNLTVFATYRLPRNWTAGARFRYASGFPLFDAQGLGQVQGRAEEFHQLDLRVDKTWIYQTWTLIAYFDIQNVYNRFNLLDTEISSEGDFAESYVLPPGTPILPILGVKGEF